MSKITNSLIAFFLLLTISSFAQDATIRGVVRDDATGDPVIYATVFISGTSNGVTTNLDGFYSINVEAGTYRVVCNYLGYDSTVAEVTVLAGQVYNQPLIMKESSVQLQTVNVSARKDEAKTEVKISSVTGEINLLHGFVGLTAFLFLHRFLEFALVDWQSNFAGFLIASCLIVAAVSICALEHKRLSIALLSLRHSELRE